MKNILIFKAMVCFFIFLFLMPGIVLSLDMRSDHISLQKKREVLKQKALLELSEAEKAAREKVLEIKKNKHALKQAILQLEIKNKTLKQSNALLENNIEKLEAEQVKLRDILAQSHGVTRELSGFIRVNARELQGLLLQSIQSAFIRDRHKFLEPMINQEKFPLMDDITNMVNILFKEIRYSGEVKITNSLIIDRKGRERDAKVLTLGNFTGIYKLERAKDTAAETGFLLYSDKSQRLFALSKLASPSMTAKMNDYFNGKSPCVPMDISKGGALRQLTHKLNLKEQIPKGGPIIWPILMIFCLALLILGERIWFFSTRQVKVEPLMTKIRTLVASNQFKECEKLLLSSKKRLIPEVLLTALPYRNRTRQDMENALQEAILGKIPPIERFLSTLGMLAAIAPLLGLLGTVTGMINTFHVITYFGASDPRMMSGGISEALVTTMLGLGVAIPIMLFHTFLNRKVETEIGRMEEKAVSFVNMIFKEKTSSGNQENA